MRITSYPGAVWLLIKRITQLGIMKVIFSKTLTRTLLREGEKNSFTSLLDKRGHEIMKNISHLTPQICSQDNSQIRLIKVRDLDQAMTQVNQGPRWLGVPRWPQKESLYSYRMGIRVWLILDIIF